MNGWIYTSVKEKNKWIMLRTYIILTFIFKNISLNENCAYS